MTKVQCRGNALIAVAVMSAWVALTATGGTDQTAAAGGEHSGIYGPFGPEGPRMREQLWILPGGDPDIPLRATVFRPDDDAAVGPGLVLATDRMIKRRRPLVIINHGTDAATRESTSMPVFYWLSRWFVERGYVVVVPQRRGHGATGGELAEAFDSCNQPEHAKAGEVAADDLAAVLAFMRHQTFVDAQLAISVGISSGGWASLALAARNPEGLVGVVSFAGGRGAYARGVPGAVCGPDALVAAAGQFGERSRVPTLWLYAANDSFFSPELAARMVKAWSNNGGQAEIHVLEPYGREGHYLADDRAGWRRWGDYLEAFLARPAASYASKS